MVKTRTTANRLPLAHQCTRGRRSLTRRSGRLVIVLWSGFALVGCGLAAQPSPARPTGTEALGAPPVPWAAIPVPTAAVSSHPAVSCSSTDLKAPDLTFAGFATGTEAFSGDLRLRSTSTCSLPQSIVASLLTSTGSVITTVSPTLAPGGVVLSSSDPAAEVDLLESGWCTAHTPSAVSLALGPGSLVLPLVGAWQGKACPPQTSYSLSIGSLAAPSPTADDFAGLVASLSAPTVATAGQPYTYEVTLTDTATAPISFQSCPAYVEGIKLPSGYSESYLLDCAAAPPIAPGASETFEMSIGIPADAPSGTWSLSWGLVGAASVANVSITIL
jgi:hypothetical protein